MALLLPGLELLDSELEDDGRGGSSWTNGCVALKQLEVDTVSQRGQGWPDDTVVIYCSWS